MKTERIKQRLNIETSKNSVNTDTYLKINLDGQQKLLPPGSINNIVDSNDRFNFERQQSKKYFESNNTIKLRYAGPEWELYFDCNPENYGTTINSIDEKWVEFVKENNEFIGDFLRATKELIGGQNLLIDKRLTKI
jgi:hypothetical protein